MINKELEHMIRKIYNEYFQRSEDDMKQDKTEKTRKLKNRKHVRKLYKDDVTRPSTVTKDTTPCESAHTKEGSHQEKQDSESEEGDVDIDEEETKKDNEDYDEDYEESWSEIKIHQHK